MARETGQVLAWDTSSNVYLLDPSGQLCGTWVASEPIVAAAFSDTGSAIAVLPQRGKLWRLDGELSNPVQHGVVRKPSALSMDPHGQYTLVSSLMRDTFVIDQFGNLVSELETSRPLVLTMFLLAEPYWIGAADHGLVGCYTLDGEPLWEDRLWSSVGALAAPATGQMILMASYAHGIQRYTLGGDNEGAYQLPGPVRHVVCTVDGTQIAASTLEGRVTLLDQSGRILWDAALDEPATSLAMDALGSYLIVGLPAGEVLRWDFVSEEEAEQANEAPLSEDVTIAVPDAQKNERGWGLREPDWSAEAVRDPEKAKVAVPGVLDTPLRLILFTADRRLKVFSCAAGERGADEPANEPIHVSEPLSGRGGLLRIAPGYVVAATERQLLVYDARDNTSTLLPTRLAEISHLAVASDRAAAIAASFASAPDRFLVDFPPVPGDDDFKIVVVDGRDRLSLLHPGGEIIWTRQLESPLQEIATAAENALGMTTDDGWLVVYNEDGELRGRRRSYPTEPMALALQMTGEGRFQFVTATRKSQLVRGYDYDANELWWTSVPFAPWRLVAAGSYVVVVSADGATFAVDEAGTGSLGPTNLPTDALFFELDRKEVATVSAGREAARTRALPIASLSASGANLTCADWQATMRWRHVASAPLGPLAHSYSGTCVLIGNQLAWFAAHHDPIGG